MTRIRGIGSTPIVELLATAADEDAAVAALGEAVARIRRARRAQARLAECDVLDLRAVLEARRTALERGPR
ncbi:MAG: hypothetical protein ABI662_09360 [Dermatophilaceae bacterium]